MNSAISSKMMDLWKNYRIRQYITKPDLPIWIQPSEINWILVKIHLGGLHLFERVLQLRFLIWAGYAYMLLISLMWKCCSWSGTAFHEWKNSWKMKILFTVLGFFHCISYSGNRRINKAYFFPRYVHQVLSCQFLHRP